MHLARFRAKSALHDSRQNIHLLSGWYQFDNGKTDLKNDQQFSFFGVVDVVVRRGGVLHRGQDVVAFRLNHHFGADGGVRRVARELYVVRVHSPQPVFGTCHAQAG